MKLTDLEAKFVRCEADGAFSEYPATAARANAVMFNCPCGCTLTSVLFFSNPGADAPRGNHREDNRWQRSGETIETLTLLPSVWLNKDLVGQGPCKSWHGWFKNGEATTVGT